MKAPSTWPPVRAVRGLWRRVLRLRPVQLALEVGRRNGRENGGQIAAALTYYAFLSIFPLLLLALSVVGFVLAGNEAAQQEWTVRLTGSIPGLGDLIARNVTAVVEGRTVAGVVGLLVLVWAGMGIVAAGRTALSHIFHRPAPGNPIVSRLRTLGALAVLGAVALGSVTATGLLFGLGGASGTGLVLRVLGILGAAVVDGGAFLLVYLVLTPGKGPRPQALLPGAVVMAVGWTGLKLLGAWYAARVVARATAVYGTFAAVIGILTILNIAAQLFVAGAVLSAVLAERRSGGGVL